MAFRRRLGNLADLFLKQNISQENARHESGLVQQRQAELARFNREQIAAEGEQGRTLQSLKQLLEDPSGRIAETYQGSGQTRLGDIDLSAVLPAIQASQRRALQQKTAEGEVENMNKLAYETQVSPILSARAGEVAEQTGLGTERATNASAPAELARKNATELQSNKNALSRERGMNPILTDRAGSTAEASAAGQLRAQASDPSWDLTAREAISNPDMLAQLTPGDRGKVIRRAAQIGLEQPNLKQQSADKMISSAEGALDRLRDRGNINAAFGQPSPTDPGSFKRWLPFGGGVNAPGSAAESTRAMVDQLTASLTLPRMEMMKGFGHLSDGDMKTLVASTTILGNPGIQDSEAHYALDTIEKTLADARVRAGLPPRTPAAPTSGSGSVRSILSRPRRTP